MFAWGYCMLVLTVLTEISYQRKLTLVVCFLVTTRVHPLSHGAVVFVFSIGFSRRQAKLEAEFGARSNVIFIVDIIPYLFL